MECAASLQLNQYMHDLDLIDQWQAHKEVFIEARIKSTWAGKISRYDIQNMLIGMSKHEGLLNELVDPINDGNYMEIGHAILKYVNDIIERDSAANYAQAEAAYEKIYGNNEHSWDRIMRENSEADAIENANEYFY